MQNKISKYIETEKLFTKTHKILVAISGGADSVALTHLLVETGYNIILAHCNFNLRANESDGDEVFVREFADGYKLQLFCKSFDTTLFAKQNGISIEMAARKLRYDWFDALLSQTNASFIATGHHADDSIETFFLNLIRGTGIRGLSGIKPINNRVVRPLIWAKRNEITDYCKQNNLRYRTDSSNFSTVYLRNHVRINIIPEFEKCSADFKSRMAENFKFIAQAEQYLNFYLQKDINDCSYNENNMLFIDIQKLISKPKPEFVLFEIIGRFGFNKTHVENILQSADNTESKVFIANEYKLVKDRLRIIITDNKTNKDEFYINANDLQIDMPFCASIELFDRNINFELIKKTDYAYLDFDLLKFPLKLRRWQKADKFVPIGMTDFKKISDFFTDLKYSPVEKDNAWLLTSGNDIVWIVGKRIDNRYKVTDQTRKIFKLSLIP